MKKHLFTISVFLMAVIGSACRLTGSSDQTSLQENPWWLITINQEALLVDTQITLTFEGDQVTGSAGCNLYSASYEVSGNRLSFGPIAQTEMACMEPTGVMEQERNYLEILGAAQSYEVKEELLTIVAQSGQILMFQPFPSSVNDEGLSLDDWYSVSQTPASNEPEVTQPADILQPPVGFKEYRDSSTGISIYIPEDWYIQSDSIIEGDYAIFSSYPPDKYTGGEPRQPGDSKCDLNLNPEIDSIDSLVQQWESSPMTTIVSEEEIVLNSGNPGTVFVIDSMGRSTALVTRINGNLVIFTCWGDFELFYEIAPTLHAATAISP